MPQLTPNFRWPFPLKSEDLTYSISAMDTFSEKSDQEWKDLDDKFKGYDALLEDIEVKIQKPTYLKAPDLDSNGTILAGTSQVISFKRTDSRYGNSISYNVMYPDGTILENIQNISIDATDSQIGDEFTFRFYANDGVQNSNEGYITITVVDVVDLELTNLLITPTDDQSIFNVTYDYSGGQVPIEIKVQTDREHVTYTKINDNFWTITVGEYPALTVTVVATDANGVEVSLSSEVELAFPGVGGLKMWGAQGATLGGVNDTPPIAVDSKGRIVMHFPRDLGSTYEQSGLIITDVDFNEDDMTVIEYEDIQYATGDMQWGDLWFNEDDILYATAQLMPTNSNSNGNILVVCKFSEDLMSMSYINIYEGFATLGSRNIDNLYGISSANSNSFTEDATHIFVVLTTRYSRALMKINKGTFQIEKLRAWDHTYDTDDRGMLFFLGDDLWFSNTMSYAALPNAFLTKMDKELNIISERALNDELEEGGFSPSNDGTKMIYGLTNAANNDRLNFAVGSVDLTTFNYSHKIFIFDAYWVDTNLDSSYWVGETLLHKKNNEFLVSGNIWGPTNLLTLGGGDTWFNLIYDADTLDFKYGYAYGEVDSWTWCRNFVELGSNYVSANTSYFVDDDPSIMVFDSQFSLDTITNGNTSWEFEPIDNMIEISSTTGTMVETNSVWIAGEIFVGIDAIGNTPTSISATPYTFADASALYGGLITITGFNPSI